MKPRDASESGSGKSVSITVPLRLIALGAILFFTALNGLYNSLNVEYGGKHTTFLFLPEDLHADLIKAALSFPPFGPDFIPGRDEDYLRYYVYNPYHDVEGAWRGELTALHPPPLIILSMLAAKRLILWLGPVELMRLYYFTSLAALALVALKFRTGFREALFIFVTLALSYPFLMILSRANLGALITSISLIFFIYELIAGKRMVVAALCLALACNCRPNAILLSPLFLVLGGRDGFRSFLIFLLAGLTLFLASYLLAHHLYPEYDLAVSRKALQIYYQKVVLQHDGSTFNNSAYAAVWPVINELDLSSGLTKKILIAAQLGITVGACGLIAVFCFYYLRRQIDSYEYAFALGSLYILGSTIFGTYHLFFMAIFLLLPGLRFFKINRRRCHYLIMAVVVLLLVPKNYIFRNGISVEVILNPILLIVALGLIWWWRAPLPMKARFWDTLHWNRD